MARGSFSDKFKQALLIAGGVALSVQAGRWFVRQRRSFEWRDKRVIITGGSRGLGLVLARQLVDEGARVAICARGEETLERAAEELRQRGGDIIASPCDVRQQEQVKHFVDEVTAQWGGVDVLVNVAGVIDVGPLDAMTVQDFYNAMQTNCWGVLYTVLAVLPSMREQGWGRIVNVASLGGKRAVPHMLPYAASKFALVGLSNGLRAELMHENILVTTACPALMRTGSPRNANFKGKHRQEYAWFSIGDSLPIVSMPAEQAAAQILEACQQGRGECYITNPLNVAVPLQNMFPQLTNDILALVDTMLPGMGGIGKSTAKGFESHSRWSPSVLTALGDRAAIENNEVATLPFPPNRQQGDSELITPNPERTES
jgi:NAD(P)-dependent dehydrogenase (short-subunit alcohol dehydrogenase family)